MTKWKATAGRTGQPARFGGGGNHVVPTVSFPARSRFSPHLPDTAPGVPHCFDDLPPADEKPRPLADWIGLIQEVCARGVDSTFELARLMNQARRSLPYGAWSRLWQSGGLPFSKRKAEKLVVIGQGLDSIDANNYSHLPAAWNTLYYLARLGRTIVEPLIAQGRVHPGLGLREAKALVAEFYPEWQQKKSRSKIRGHLARFAAFVRADISAWSAAERKWAGHKLKVLAAEIQGAARLTSFNPQPSLETLAQTGSLAQTLEEPSISKL